MLALHTGVIDGILTSLVVALPIFQGEPILTMQTALKLVILASPDQALALAQFKARFTGQALLLVVPEAAWGPLQTLQFACQVVSFPALKTASGGRPQAEVSICLGDAVGLLESIVVFALDAQSSLVGFTVVDGGIAGSLIKEQAFATDQASVFLLEDAAVDLILQAIGVLRE